ETSAMSAHDPHVLSQLAADLQGTGSLSIRTGVRRITYRATQDTILVHEGVEDGDTLVVMSESSWHDLVALMRTFIHLYLNDELEFVRGGFGQLADWDRALTYLHGGIPPYLPGRADLQGRDPAAVLSLDNTDGE